MIRQATREDIPHMIDLGAQMHAESRFSVLGYDREKVAALFSHLLDTDQFIEVIERDGVLIGGFAGFVTEHWASKDLVSYDCGLFISPDHRGGGASRETRDHRDTDAGIDDRAPVPDPG